MRTRYIVAYDIADDRRWRAVYKIMRGHGDRVQYSVFRCDLAATEKALFMQALIPLLDHSEDQVLFIDIGPADGRGADCIESIGQPYVAPQRGPIIV